MADEKLPFLDPYELDPVTGLEKQTSTKEPINPEVLDYSSAFMTAGPQDVGQFFERESK